MKKTSILSLLKYKLYVLIVFIATIPISIFSQSQKFRGYPESSKNQDVLPGFTHPPKGYGNVPFYWWNGDSLNTERLKEQLDILASSATDGFSVSYMHLHPRADSEDMKPEYGLFGNTEGGRPEFFSEEWWKTWSWFTEECAKRNMGLGLDDYTVGWTGNGYYPDEIAKDSKFKSYQGELEIVPIQVSAGSTFKHTIPENLVSAVAWPGSIDLTKHVSGKHLVWNVPSDKSYTVYIITTKAGYLLHPEYGNEMVRVYFDRFEAAAGKSAEKGMNYFFQDEMLYPISIGSWSEDFQSEFIKRKGYDITLFLPALKNDIGSATPKIRIDYCDVLIDLAEERYMKPIYEWHEKRGLIYGSDNLGRGLEPLSYVDYFRINSWYTAPGNDAPAKGSSFIQTKVSSSIAHLHERPRTWLEAFHSMGWSSSGAWLTKQMDHHMIAGGNLVCMHGLYYSTHGGWWEWAPPCFHFRMPYWPHMKTWLEYTERMSYLLSQGDHVCDILLVYPTESMQAYPEANTDIVFDQALKLSNAGLDYDFVNYISLRNAKVKNNVMQIGREEYKIIVLADIKAMDHAALLKVLEFYRAGGIVLATGELPKATNKSGEKDKEVDAILKEIFNLTATDALSGKTVEKPSNVSKGTGMYISNGEVVENIYSLITPDFKATEGGGKVLHRRIGYRDVYMVTDVEKGTECFFRSTGKVELWNASNGTTEIYPIISQNNEGTWLKLDKESNNSYLIVFSPGQPIIDNVQALNYQQTKTVPIDGSWEVELLPTLDNKWGDYRLPATNEFIAAEARSFKHQPNDLSDKTWIYTDFDDSKWKEAIYGYGEQAFSYTIPATENIEEAINKISENKLANSILEFSWQYGVWDNPGSQGYHGLKAKVSNGFFILDQGGHQLYKTYVYSPQKALYKVAIEGVNPDYLLINNKVANEEIELSEGWYEMIIGYKNTNKQEFKVSSDFFDPRNRSAVVLIPSSSAIPEKPTKYDNIVSTRWGITDHLQTDPYKNMHRRWNYRFHSAPGMQEMEFTVAGKNLNVWFNGKALAEKNVLLLKTTESGNNIYKVTFDEIQKEIGLVAFSLDREIGYQGAATICEPIKLKTTQGLLPAGDWSTTGALKYYSGGMIYKKEIDIAITDTKDKKIMLNLGDVVASCEIEVNGTPVGVLMSPPYEFDITDHVKSGKNGIKILVYSTLSNHYQTIPSPYRGEPVAGMLGPVQLKIYSTE